MQVEARAGAAVAVQVGAAVQAADSVQTGFGAQIAVDSNLLLHCRLLAGVLVLRVRSARSGLPRYLH